MVQLTNSPSFADLRKLDSDICDRRGERVAREGGLGC
jgi:hypothetical protein